MTISRNYVYMIVLHKVAIYRRILREIFLITCSMLYYHVVVFMTNCVLSVVNRDAIQNVYNQLIVCD